MHPVIETPSYLGDLNSAGVTIEGAARIVAIIASDPEAGDLIVGTGGARKVRIGGRGKGKSGGYRVVTYYAAKEVPAFALISKGERADLSQAERNALKAELASLADDYRAGLAAKVNKLRTSP
ncbi:MAG TPA: type II toxin-antitoxin system RelE/ParE family toxin [Roseiarcus sp.]|nr:type II toxin-antitoxin system RelE/ParE family toxin [Roseiarcus sp.]